MFVVAGASGQVGSVVAAALLRENQPVTVILRTLEQANPWRERGARVRIGSLEDSAFLTETLAGAAGLFVLQPPNYRVPNFLAAQAALAETIAASVRQSRVPHVVLLSSFGAHLVGGTGPIQGAYQFEQQLSSTGTKLSVLRSSYFQENVRHAFGPARGAGIFPTLAPKPDEPFPHISTVDVGEFCARFLLDPEVVSEAVDLVGPSYSNRDVAIALGAALGKKLELLEVPRAGWTAALRESGMPPEIAELFAEMNDALAQGRLVPVCQRQFHGSTTLEQTLQRLLRP